jgi:hypothetical protein
MCLVTMEERQHQEVGSQLEHLAYTLKPGALTSALYERAEELLNSGYPREQLLQNFKHLLLDMRANGRKDLEDDVLDVMDALVGWCAPSTRL